MVALSSETLDTALQAKDLRWKIGAVVALVWVLTELWIASPFPYMLGDAAGISLVINGTQSRGLHLGFALCLAFALFPSRWMKLPWSVDVSLAVIAGVSGSIIAWNYDHISLNPVNPGTFSLTVAFVGIVMLALATLRVFGWLGAVFLTLVVLAHLSPALQGAPAPAALQGLDAFLNLHWFTTESAFGVLLGISVSSTFLLVVLGVALDVVGCGRRLSQFALCPLPNDVEKERLAERHPFARRFWALTLLLFFFPLMGGAGFDHRGFIEHIRYFAWPIFFCLIAYGVFLTFAWGVSRVWKGRWGGAVLSVAVGGMLFGFAQLLALLLSVFLADVLQGRTFGVPRFGDPAVWLFIALLFSFLVTYLARSSADAAKRKTWLAVLVILPFVVFFLAASIEWISPGLSAFYAVIMMLAALAERHLVVERDTGSSTLVACRSFVSLYLLPLGYGTARVMLRVAILAALYGMAVPWAPFWSPFYY